MTYFKLTFEILLKFPILIVRNIFSLTYALLFARHFANQPKIIVSNAKNTI